MKPLKTIITILISTSFVLGFFWWDAHITPVGALTVTISSDFEPAFAEIENIEMSIESIALHYPEDGWSNISYPDQELLLAEVAENEGYILLDSVKINSHPYDMIRLSFSNVTIATDQTDIAADIPAPEIEIPTDIRVSNNETANVHVRIDTVESIKRNIDDEGYVFLPHLQSESRSNIKMQPTRDNTYMIYGGKLRAKNRVYIDDTGNSNYRSTDYLQRNTDDSQSEESLDSDEVTQEVQ